MHLCRRVARGDQLTGVGPKDYGNALGWRFLSEDARIMSLEPGQSLGPYKVLTLLGEGGMGQVWRATDTQLGRDVALKILPDAFAADPDRLARFKREAQILASLNHPNIAAIYGIEEAPATRAPSTDGDAERSQGSGQAIKALVLELVEGPTLADRIAQGPIPLDEALPIAKQIAEALEAAHEVGVIHRDLKPANIKVREDGTVKVLDFGLAKALDTTPEGDPSQSPTLTAMASQAGVIMGTAAYMSPEQARGEPVDKRADIWAFGVVLLEMLTGQQTFVGKTVSDTLAFVLTKNPDWAVLPPTTPAQLRQLLRRSLEKARKARIPDIGIARIEIDDALTAPTAEATQAAPSLQVWQRPIAAVMIVLALVTVTGLVVRGLIGTAPDRTTSLVQFVVNPPPDRPLGANRFGPNVAISPDGTRIIYASDTVGAPGSGRRLYLRPVDQLEATPIRGTEGGSFPVFSPDGDSVAFYHLFERRIKRVPTSGGPSLTIAAAVRGLRGLTWGVDDTIVFGPLSNPGLLRVPARGGEPEVLTTPDPDVAGVSYRWPDFLPDGQAVLFTSWEGSAESSRIAVVSLATREVTYLLSGGSNPRYASTGHIVYGVGGALWAVGFDSERLTVTNSRPVPVVENVSLNPNGAAAFGVSDDGGLVYVRGDAIVGAQRTLVWVDRDGMEEPLPIPPRAYTRAAVSPDGSRVAVVIQEGSGNTDVWTSEVARGTLSRVTTDPAVDDAPLWTPDGERLVFSSNRDGQLGLYWKDSDGRGDVEQLVSLESQILSPYAVTPDGTAVLFNSRTTANGFDVNVLSLQEERSWTPLIASAVNEGSPSLSPDGFWVAYNSDETGQNEVYMERFPDLGERRLVSIGGGDDPLWSPDGRELFYRSLSNEMMSVAVVTEPTLTLGRPEVVFAGAYFQIGGRRHDISPDGQRFLLIKPSSGTEDSGDITVILNWSEDLRRLVPVD